MRTNEVTNRMIKDSLEKIRFLNLVGWISPSFPSNCFDFLGGLIRMRRRFHIIEKFERFTKRGRVGE